MQIETIYSDLSGCLFHQSYENPHKGGLARAIWTEQTEQAAAYLKIDISEGLLTTPVLLEEIANDNFQPILLQCDN